MHLRSSARQFLIYSIFVLVLTPLGLYLSRIKNSNNNAYYHINKIIHILTEVAVLWWQPYRVWEIITINNMFLQRPYIISV